jgi:hypothetical protein
MLREPSKIVQMVVQVIIDAFDIYLRVDMDEKVTKPRHLHQRAGKRGRKVPASRRSSMASCDAAGTPSARSATR